jgi:hypothetical protein
MSNKEIEIIILANSIKHGQHCVAGKHVKTGQWIRAVADEQGAELNHEQVKYQNPYGSFSVKPLQKIIMGISAHAPLSQQPENYIVDGSKWRQNFKITNEELNKYLDNPEDIWGASDRVAYSSIISGIINITQSLYLVSVESLQLYRNDFGKRRASFIYKETSYDLAVTDPNFDHIVDNDVKVQGILCISLGEELDGNCYKIVATIF